MDDRDRKHLGRALDLAERGCGCTSPNPIVGAVIVRDAKVVGEGWHVGVGLEHAEVSAIRDGLSRAGHQAVEAGDELDWEAARTVCAGATMYVTLEPCCVQGRTPPCTDALIRCGFTRVVIATIDPTPSVNGRGCESLRAAGIAVEIAEGPIAERARGQNQGVRKYLASGLPYVIYKYAMTLDGRVATDDGDSRWISSQASRAVVHRWRAHSDAVVVGAGTVKSDDPTLTAREVSCLCQPLRVVVDRECSLGEESNLVRTGGESTVLVVCGEDVDAKRRAQVESWGVTTATVGLQKEGGLDPEQVCGMLATRGVRNILLEGGPRLAGAWWAAGMIDKVAAFVCPRLVSGREAGGPLWGKGVADVADALELREVDVERVGADVLITGYTGASY